MKVSDPQELELQVVVSHNLGKELTSSKRAANALTGPPYIATLIKSVNSIFLAWSFIFAMLRSTIPPENQS